MKYQPLSREEMIRVIEGRGNASRVPVLLHMWTGQEVFAQRADEISAIKALYPQDAQLIPLHIPQVYDAPSDDPSYRWSFKDSSLVEHAHDEADCIVDWEADLPRLLEDFPSPDYPGLLRTRPAPDGRYRLGHWWFFFFERHWSLRGMTNALMDYYSDPESVHALFRKLCDFYKAIIVRAHAELGLDGIFTSDDLGTQSSVFFSPEIFAEFFAPYYREVIELLHSLGMHFWLHTCGNIERLIPQFIDMGVDVLHPIQKYTMDERHIAASYGDKLAIWAGFDVQQIIPWGTPEEVRREVRFMMDTYARADGRFLFTAGNMINQDCPTESLRAIYDEAYQYGSKVVIRCAK